MAVHACRLRRVEEARVWLGRALELGGKVMKLCALDDRELAGVWEAERLVRGLSTLQKSKVIKLGTDSFTMMSGPLEAGADVGEFGGDARQDAGADTLPGMFNLEAAVGSTERLRLVTKIVRFVMTGANRSRRFPRRGCVTCQFPDL